MFNKRQHQVLLSSEQVVVQKNLNYPASIKEIMHTWILQMNYPVVTVTIPQNGTVRATQQRFLRNPEAKDPLVYISPFGYGLLIFLNNIIAYYLIMIFMYPNNVKYMTFSPTILIWIQFNKFPLAKSLKITWHCNDLIRECLVYMFTSYCTFYD